MEPLATARRMWQLYEPVHALTYFAPEALEEFMAAGLKGFWMGYFAGRSVPMGAVEPAVVTATFFNFSPTRVERALPDAWSFSSPDRVLEARLAGIDRALRGIVESTLSPADARRAADLARAACDELDVGGRPLAAANTVLPWPDDALLSLWQATTVLREHRGDGHVAALVAAGLDGRQALVSMAGTGAAPRELLQGSRGWDDDAWTEAAEVLGNRGWLAPDGALTATGLVGRQEIEDTTDRLAASPWQRLGDERTDELASLLGPIVKEIAARGGLLVPNPMGLRPAD